MSLHMARLDPQPLGDVFVKRAADGRWWIDDGFGVNVAGEFYDTSAVAVRAAFSQLRKPAARVLVQHGAEWLDAAVPALVGQGSPHEQDVVPDRAGE